MPARLRENGWAVARAAGQLPAQNAGRVPTWLLTCTAPAVRRTLALARSASAVPGGAGVVKLEAVRPLSSTAVSRFASKTLPDTLQWSPCQPRQLWPDSRRLRRLP